MNDSKQLAILKALTTQLERVTPGNGYDFDFSGKVFRGRLLFGTETAVPFVSILEDPRPGQADSVGDGQYVRKPTWRLLVQGWAQDDDANPLDPAYGMKASAEKVLARLVQKDKSGRPLFPDEYLLGKRVISIDIGPGVCRPGTDVSSVAFFYLPVVIEYGEDLSQPFE
jgi:hypothetical protein